MASPEARAAQRSMIFQVPAEGRKESLTEIRIVVRKISQI